MSRVFSDGPENLITSPVSSATVGLHNRSKVLVIITRMMFNVRDDFRTSLSCSADAVPSPGYEWLQELPGGGEVRRRSNTATLEIEDAWYADQGLYRCVLSCTGVQCITGLFCKGAWRAITSATSGGRRRARPSHWTSLGLRR